MFNFSQMFSSPKATEMMFNIMAQQAAQTPPEIRDALSRVQVTIIKKKRGFGITIGESDNEQVTAMIESSIGGWCDLLLRGFQTVGYDVHIYE